MGQRLTTMTSVNRGFPAHRPSSCAAWRKPHVGERSCAVGRRKWSTICASCAACTPRPSITSRPSASFKPATRLPAGRAWVRGHVRIGPLNHNLPTFVVLFARATNTKKSQAISARCGRRILARRVLGRAVSQHGRSDSCLSTIRRACRPRCGGNARSFEALNEFTYRDLGDPETQDAHSAV